MLVLHANQEQENLFNKLIQAIGAQVVWNGRFLIMGDRLVLEGMVRSLFFHYDIQKAEVELADLPEMEGEVVEMSAHPLLGDIITITLYAFEKWGVLKGLYVEQDISQLNQIFKEIVGAYHLEAEFSENGIQFYKSGIRITYEEVLEAALGFEKKFKGDSDIKLLGSRLALPVFEYGDNIQINKKTPSAAPGAADGPDKEASIAERIEKYHARMSVLGRLSGRQKKELVRDIKNDRLLDDKQKEELIFPVEDFEYKERMKALEEEFSDRKNRTYAYVKKAIKKAELEELTDKTKQALFQKLEELRLKFGEEEIRQIMETVPKHVERTEYQDLKAKLAPYEGLDMSSYEELLRKMRETLEIKEISNMLMQSPKKSREDFTALLRQIEEKDFADENAGPYIERILEWVREIDEENLKKMLEHVKGMGFEAAADLYIRIQQESFLPKLRENAVAVLSKHLKAIRMEECRLLVQKFQEMAPAAVGGNPKHYYYWNAGAIQKDTKVIDNALSAYAEEKGLFEYPIIAVDTSKGGNGRDGMLLTPEHLFYSTRLSGYRIPVPSVKSIQVSSGLLNRRIILEEENGARHKLPYAVAAEEMQAWAEVLDKFVRYLKGRQVSGKLSYQALLEDNTVHCGRCGHACHGEQACPECGEPISNN